MSEGSGETAEQVIVVGAGIAGLSAALSLAEAGLSPLVLEADPHYCGGRLSAQPAVEFSHAGRTWSFPGEHGIHGLWRGYGNLRGLLGRHGLLPPLVPADRQDWVYARGSRVQRAEIGRRLRSSPIPAPFHYLSLLANPRFLAMFGPLELLQVPWAGIHLLTMLALDPMADGSRMEGRTARESLPGWPLVLKAFAGALSRSGLSTGADDVPLAGFVALFRSYSLLRRDALAYDYLPGDPGSTLIDPVVRRIEALGGRVVRGARAAGLERADGRGWRVLVQRATGGPSASWEAAQVILAMDAPGARSLLLAGEGTARLAKDLWWPEARATAAARLWFSGAPRGGAEGGMFGGDFVLDNFFWLDRLHDPFMAWRRHTGGGVMEAHIYGPPSLLAEPDTVLLPLALRDAVRAYPELRGSLIHGAIQRNAATHTLVAFGPAARHLGVDTPWPGVHCCGDWVRHPSPALFLERASLTGIEAANRVRAACGLPALPLVPAPGPEPLASVVENLARASRSLAGGIHWVSRRASDR